MANLINTDADADLAMKLQKEEYSKDSLFIRRPRHEPSTADDAAIAARLQAEEDARHERQAARRQRRELRRPVPELVVPMPLHDLMRRQDDFTPNDYERLMELGGEEPHRRLDNQQINVFPTETFVPRPNQSEQDTTCSVCWDKYEAGNVLRRLPCLHTFHRDCIDPWLKVGETFVFLAPLENSSTFILDEKPMSNLSCRSVSTIK